MSKKLTVLLAAALLGAGAARADYAITVDSTFVSQYYFRGVKLSGPSLQPSIEVTSGNLALGVWSSNEVGNWSGSNYSEFDFYGSYTYEISDELSVPVGATWYYYPTADLNSGLYRNTFEAFIGLNYSIGGVSLSPKAYYDFVLKSWTFEATAGYSLPLEALGTSLDFSVFAGTWVSDAFSRETSPDVEAENSYYGFGVEIPYQLAENAKVTVGAVFHDGLESELKQGGMVISRADLGPGRLIYSVSLTVGF